MRVLPQSVVGRAGAILAGAVLALVLIGYWAFRQGIEDVALGIRARALAERLVTIQRSMEEIANEDERDRIAHGMSSASLEVHWSKVSLVLGNSVPSERARDIEKRLKILAPDLSSRQMRIGFADDGALGTGDTTAYEHMLLLSVSLSDSSWVNFATPTFGIAEHMPFHVLLTAVVVGLGIAFLALVLLYRVTRPLAVLADAAERFSLDTHGKLVDESGPLEVHRAAHAFNTMGTRIRTLVAERTQALAAVSHDLRTPITRLRLRAELADDPELRRLMENDLAEMEAMVDATLDFLKAGGAAESDLRPVDVVSVLSTIVDTEADLGRNIRLEGAAHAIVRGDVVALKRGFANLVSNALKFGTQARVQVSSADGEVLVVIADDGPGIGEHDLTRVLEPFVRLETSRNRQTGGVGLGLTIARSIFGAHGGSLTLANRATGGLAAQVRIPGLAAPAETAR